MEVLKYRKDANSPWQSLIGIKGERGEAGYTPVKGVDYFTEEEVNEIIQAAAAGGGELGDAFATVEYVDTYYIELMNVKADVKDVYSKTEVDGLLANLPTGGEAPDLSGYVTDEELAQAIGGIVHPTPDLSDYITEDELNGKLYATTTYVNQQIAQIQHPTTDLSNYYTKSEVEALIPPSGEEVSY